MIRPKRELLDSEDEFLTTEQLSGLLHIPAGTLRQWRHRGYGPPGIRLGNTVLYRRSAALAWVASREREEEQRAAARHPRSAGGRASA